MAKPKRKEPLPWGVDPGLVDALQRREPIGSPKIYHLLAFGASHPYLPVLRTLAQFDRFWRLLAEIPFEAAEDILQRSKVDIERSGEDPVVVKRMQAMIDAVTGGMNTVRAVVAARSEQSNAQGATLH